MNLDPFMIHDHWFIVVEAAGVELFRVLITHNLLILGIATTAKKAPLPDPLYVYCTKMLPLWSRPYTTPWPQYPIDSWGWRKKHSSSSTAVSPFHSGLP